MKLSNLVNTVRMQVREVENFIRYPLQTVSRIGMRRLQDEYEKVELPGEKERQDKLPENQQYKESKVTTNNGRQLNNYVASSNIKDTATAVNIAVVERLAKRQSRTAEVIPHLPKNHEIRGGRRGRYRVGDLLKDGERVRLYEGFHVLNNKQILIKEYLLPDKDFNQKESRERKEKFDRVSNINLKNGGGQDFRLISPWDAIAPTNASEKRCYLILEQSFATGLTLREYLAENGPMTGKQVRQVLYQILQTLWFLHNQKLRFANEEIQSSLPHGNLSLDSLVIVENQPSTNIDDPQFFIYVGDLALWEDLFKPPNSKIVHHSVEKDLVDLGYVSFYLLAGTTINQNTGENLNPKQEEQWPIVKDVALKRFIYHLLGIEKPFATAFEARQALLASPVQHIKEEIEETKEPAQISPTKKSSLWKTLLIVLLLAILAGFIGQMIWMAWQLLSNGKDGVIVRPRSGINSLAEVPKVPTGNTNYTTEADGIWRYVFNNRFADDLTLEQELKNREPRLKNYKFSATGNNVIGDIRADRAEFALTKFIDNLPGELKQTIVAYDGLVAFVAFSDSGRDATIPKSFQGKISLTELRDLYRNGQIKNWQPPPNFQEKIKLYKPIDNAQVLQAFEKTVLQNNRQDVARFRNQIELNKKILKKQQEQAFNEKAKQLYRQRMSRYQRLKLLERERQRILNAKQDERYILGEVLKDFETKKTVSIGFGLLSRVFDQCSVYPLAIETDSREVPVLISADRNKNKPLYETMDLCSDKGSYKPNIEAFQSQRYPLVVPLVVVYPKNSQKGEAFAKLLLTNEGQSLLGAAGLIPVRKLTDD
ncbi:MAG TPA: hypothetical protein V6D28_16000 [Leptolyngbyaceae cyanobacterium]